MNREAYDRLYEELLRTVRDTLGDEGTPDDDTARDVISRITGEDPRLLALPVSARLKLSRSLFFAVRRLDVLQELLDDPGITEIMVIGPDTIYIERNGRLFRSEKRFGDADKLLDVVRRIAGRCNRVISESSPIVDARLPDGSRINALIAPVALNGPILTIRRFPEDPLTMDDLIRAGSISREAAEFLKKAVRARRSILISGGTSAGKTTFLNILSSFIPPDERIITIEDNAELQIRGIGNLVRLEAKPANMEGAAEITIRDLIRSALRQRPDRVVIGECRGAEAVDMLQALNTGHDGSMSTLHANSAADALSRLTTMVLMGTPLPLEAIRAQIVSGVDLIVHLGRLADGSRHVLEILALDGTADGRIRTKTLYAKEPGGKTTQNRSEALCQKPITRAYET